MIGPVSAAGFPCGEIPKYRKKAPKKTPKKADHKHEYERVILSYINQSGAFDPFRGFVPRRDYSAGSRCIHCGRLTVGFPDGKAVAVAARVPTDGTQFSGKKIIVLKPEYRDLPVVKVKSIFDLELEEEKENGQ